MLKRGILITLIILLSISLIIVLFKYKEISTEINSKQNHTDMIVRGDLNVASSSFAGVSLMTESGKELRYNQAMSMIASASQLLNYSAYDKNNNDLCGVLINLSSLMESSEYKEALMQKSDSMHQVLSQLSLNPGDKKATEDFFKLIVEIRQNK